MRDDYEYHEQMSDMLTRAAKEYLAADGCVECGETFTKQLRCCCAQGSYPTFPIPGEKEYHVNGRCVKCCKHVLGPGKLSRKAA